MKKTTLCYIEKDNRYLMLHRAKKEADDNAGKWVGVGGKIEPGETPEECLLREVYEETGLTLTGYECVGLVKFRSDTYEDEDMYLYRGTAFTGEVTTDCPEGELQWIPAQEVTQLPVWEGDRYFLEALRQKRKNICMTLRYEKDKLAEFRDDTEETQILTSTLIQTPHGFSTRYGGVSEGIYRSLNLGMNRGDDRERVIENWRRFLEACGIYKNEIVCGKQVHGKRVCIAGKEQLRRIHSSGEMPEADGYVTKERDVALAVFIADCVPVLLEDAVNGVIGAVHSGWRSTAADIEGEAIGKMVSLGAQPKQICAAIGPAIGKCCFEVGPEVVSAMEKLLGGDCGAYYEARGEKYLLDLQGIVKKRLLQLGVCENHIELVGGCTMCEHERYWSHRYTKGERGSLAAVIMR